MVIRHLYSAVLVAVVTACSVIHADEFENMVESDIPVPAPERVEKTASENSKRNMSETPDSLPTVKKRQPRPVRRIDDADINSSQNTDLLMLALQKKEMELELARKRIAELEAWIVKIKEASRKERATFCYNMGCVFKASRHFARAEAQFLKALEINPRDPDIHYNLAILYDDDMDDSEKAEKHYRRFLELSPDDEDAAAVIEWLGSLTRKPGRD